MKSGRTLVSLAQELQRQLHSKKDLVVPSQLMHHDTGDSGQTQLVIEEGGGTVRYGVTPLARRQLANKLKIPHAYFERMREEQPVLLDRNVSTWLQSEDERRMLRTLDGQVRAVLPSAAAALPPGALGGAVAQEMASVNQRLFDNAYFRSIDTLVLLAAFRLSTLLEWLPWLAAFALAVLVDGWIVRLIKSREFRRHDPELFGLYACLAIVLACATVVGLVVPLTLHPLVMPGVPIAISVLLSRAVGSFHRRA